MSSSKIERSYSRAENELRPMTVEVDVNIHAEGSVLISMGNTKVICTASVEEKVPRFLKGEGKGWVTAEYSMLPRATSTRNSREAARGKQGGRTVEIQRLIGRSLRQAIDMTAIGERTIWVDCDVIQADGGTRTASITGGFIAMGIAMAKLFKDGKIEKNPMRDYLAAISVGVVNGTPLLDLDYKEDFAASTDMNLVMMGDGRFVELQGTAEEEPYGRDELNSLIDIGWKGISELIEEEKKILEPLFS